jgi:beta-lactamase class A
MILLNRGSSDAFRDQAARREMMKKHTDRNPAVRSGDSGRDNREEYYVKDHANDNAMFYLGKTRQNSHTYRQRKLRRGLLIVLACSIVILLIGFLILRSQFPSLFIKTGISTTTAKTSQISGLMSSQTSTSNSSMSASTATPTTAKTSSASTSTTSQSTTTVGLAARALAFANAKTAVAALTVKYKGRYAIYYQNLTVNEQYAINADRPFVAASSIKLGINTFLYTQIAAGKINPTEVLIYDSRAYPTGDYEAGTGTIQGQPNGTRYSVRDTSGLSIRISDNCATNMVIRRLGGIDQINPFLNSISAVVDYRKSVTYTNYVGTTSSGRHRTSATDLALHAVKLFQLYQNNQAIYQPLIDDLCKTEFDFGIQKGIPTTVRVAHKIGTNGTYNTENDVGIVFADEPFVLCVMTESGNATTAHQFQADIAKIFYQYIDGLSG